MRSRNERGSPPLSPSARPRPTTALKRSCNYNTNPNYNTKSKHKAKGKDKGKDTSKDKSKDKGAMDMTRHLKRWINDAELQRRGDRYEGVIESVTEEHVRNRFTAQRELHPVIVFDDGWRIIPNLSMRRSLIEIFGTAETAAWISRRLTIFRRRVERMNRATGEIRERYEKAVLCSDAHAREPIMGAWPQADLSSNGDGDDPVQPVKEPLMAADIFEKRRTR